MADISSFQNAGSYNTQTAPGAGFSTPGFGGGDWGAFFDMAAKRKAAALAEEKRRYDQEFAFKQQQAEAAQRAQQEAMSQQAIQSDMDRAPRQLQGISSPKAEYTPDMYGHQYWKVDPNQAALANAQAGMQGAKSNPFHGGTTSMQPGVFDSWSSDSIRAGDMGQAPPMSEPSYTGAMRAGGTPDPSLMKKKQQMLALENG